MKRVISFYIDDERDHEDGLSEFWWNVAEDAKNRWRKEMGGRLHISSMGIEDF